MEAAKRILGEETAHRMLREGVVGAIGHPTRLALEEIGVRVDVIPESADFLQLLQSIKAVFEKQ